MKSHIKIISLFLALFVICAAPIAIRAEEKGEEAIPIITLRGGWNDLFINAGSLEEELAFDSLDLVNVFTPAVGGVLLGAATLNLNRAVDAIRDTMWDWMGGIQMDESGESIAQGLSGGNNYREENIFGKIINFDYDWRLDPIENAKELNKFLEHVSKTRGNKKFHVRVLSGSGPIMLVYLKQYGTDRLASLMLEQSMHNGATTYGALFTRDYSLDAKALGHSKALGVMGIEVPLLFFAPILRALYEIGLLEKATGLVDLAIQDAADRAYDEILIPLYFHMPGFWAYIPADDFEKAKKSILGDDPKYAGLIKKIDRYHYDYMANADEIILQAASNVKIAVRAGYGRPLQPITKGAAVHSDGLLDTAYASLGATCAPMGRRFGSDYVQQIDHGGLNYISPDRMIDASTCLLPDRTWFSKGSPHRTVESYSGWYEWFISTENPTVFNSEAFPQYVEEIKSYVFVPVKAKRQNKGFHLGGHYGKNEPGNQGENQGGCAASCRLVERRGPARGENPPLGGRHPVACRDIKGLSARVRGDEGPAVHRHGRRQNSAVMEILPRLHPHQLGRGYRPPRRRIHGPQALQRQYSPLDYAL